jgi:cyclopropane-fatty-acyl-phospholipid synthase
MLIRILNSVIRTGILRVTDAAGRRHSVGDGTIPRAAIRLTSKRLECSLLLNPGLSVGEAFMDGAPLIEDGTLYDFLDAVARNFDNVGRLPWPAFIGRIGQGLKQHNPIGKAQRNVVLHYDLSAELYDIFLDRDWQ